MDKLLVKVGQAENDGTGDKLRDGGIAYNAIVTDIYTKFGGGVEDTGNQVFVLGDLHPAGKWVNIGTEVDGSGRFVAVSGQSYSITQDFLDNVGKIKLPATQPENTVIRLRDGAGFANSDSDVTVEGIFDSTGLDKTIRFDAKYFDVEFVWTGSQWVYVSGTNINGVGFAERVIVSYEHVLVGGDIVSGDAIIEFGDSDEFRNTYPNIAGYNREETYVYRDGLLLQSDGYELESDSDDPDVQITIFNSTAGQSLKIVTYFGSVVSQETTYTKTPETINTGTGTEVIISSAESLNPKALDVYADGIKLPTDSYVLDDTRKIVTITKSTAGLGDNTEIDFELVSFVGTVGDTNVYTKSQTYSKQEVDNLISVESSARSSKDTELDNRVTALEASGITNGIVLATGSFNLSTLQASSVTKGVSQITNVSGKSYVFRVVFNTAVRNQLAGISDYTVIPVRFDTNEVVYVNQDTQFNANEEIARMVNIVARTNTYMDLQVNDIKPRTVGRGAGNDNAWATTYYTRDQFNATEFLAFQVIK